MSALSVLPVASLPVGWQLVVVVVALRGARERCVVVVVKVTNSHARCVALVAAPPWAVPLAPVWAPWRCSLDAQRCLGPTARPPTHHASAHKGSLLLYRSKTEQHRALWHVPRASLRCLSVPGLCDSASCVVMGVASRLSLLRCVALVALLRSGQLHACNFPVKRPSCRVVDNSQLLLSTTKLSTREVKFSEFSI